MSGCNFLDKTFSVAVSSGNKEGKCPKCGGGEPTYKYNRERMCKECFDKIPPIKSFDSGNFNTTKDKLYDFYSVSLGMKIENKSQWKRELKKRGLTDNFDQSFNSRKRDIERVQSQQHSQRKHSHEEVKNGVREALKSMNMYSREKLFIPKDKAPMGMRYR